jgi:hypothetical protein
MSLFFLLELLLIISLLFLSVQAICFSASFDEFGYIPLKYTGLVWAENTLYINLDRMVVVLLVRCCCIAVPTVAVVDGLIIMVLVLAWSAILVINCFRLLVHFLLFIFRLLWE